MKLPWIHSRQGFTYKDRQRPESKTHLVDRILAWSLLHISSPLPIYLFDLFAISFGQPCQPTPSSKWRLKTYKKVSDMDPKVSKYMMVSKGFWIPKRIQLDMAVDPEAYVRNTLATRPNLKPQTVNILVKDTSSSVIEALMGNPTIDETLRTELALGGHL